MRQRIQEWTFHLLHTLNTLRLKWFVDWRVWVIYFGGIRLFYVPKGYPCLMSESRVPIFDEEGTAIFEICTGEELTVLATVFL